MGSHLSLDELERLLSGEGEGEAVSHVRGCDDCRGKLAEIAARERAMLDLGYRWDCPAALELYEHVAGVAISPAVAAHIGSEGDGCPLCVEEAELFRVWEHPRIHSARPSRPLRERVRTVMATLVPQPSMLPALRGIAGTGQVYQAGALLVTLERRPSMKQAGRRALHGSLLALDADLEQYEGIPVQLVRDGALVGESRLSAFGSFSFDALPEGHYRLLLSLPTRRVIIDNLALD